MQATTAMTTSHNFDYDLLVIGAGSGGVRASRMAASFGAKVAVIEDQYMGGTCVNVGCVPKKLYVYAAEFAQHFRDAAGYGWQTSPAIFNWSTLRDNKIQEIERLNGIYTNILSNAKVDIIRGHGVIENPNTVIVGKQRYNAAKLLIATGGTPFIPDIPGKEYGIHSNDIFDLAELPEHITIVGGGYIACEFAGIFHGLGCKVTQLYRGDKILRGFDNDVRTVISQEMINKGIDLRTQTTISAIEQTDKQHYKVRLSDGNQLTSHLVFFATGRTANINKLGLENTAVTLNEKGQIRCNEKFQTDEPTIFALGDVIGGMELTPVALEEGMSFAKHYFNDEPFHIDYSNIATAVFTQPNIATCGLTEQEATEKGLICDVYESNFRAMKNTLSGNDERTYMKLIVDSNTDQVIGIHMVGENAGEIIQGLAVAMKAGASKAQFDATIGIHPTAAEEFVTMRNKRS